MEASGTNGGVPEVASSPLLHRRANPATNQANNNLNFLVAIEASRLGLLTLTKMLRPLFSLLG
jgi:hypothetical protein